MKSAQYWLDVVSHNLANVSTTGYKRQGVAFNDTLTRAMYGEGGRYLGELGAGTTLQREYTVMDVGSVTTTGNMLDVAIQSREGFFAIETGEGIRYTRDGSFSLNANRELVTKDGHLVLDQQENAIVLPSGQIEINTDGAVSVDGTAVGTLGVFDGAVVKSGSGLFIGQDMQRLNSPSLLPGAIEGSNVNAIEQMIEMIRLNRIYEMAQRSAQGQDEMTQKLIQSIQNR